MLSYLNQRLSRDHVAVDAIKRGDARKVFILAAAHCIGIRESGGNNSGPMVELMQRTLGGADKEPWCMAAVQTWLAYAEEACSVVSPVYASEHCLTVWRNTPEAQRVKICPNPGAIIIWRHGNTDSGHTGITFSPVVGDSYEAIEGNTESGIVGGRIERDGGGVYSTRRTLTGSDSMRVVGFLKPF